MNNRFHPFESDICCPFLLTTYRRHISIAQTAVDWIILFQIDHKDTSRIEKIVNCYNGSVALWAKQYEQ